MPQFKVAKTNDKTKIENNAIIEDKLYIYKETNKFGRIFYNFDEETRIEIGSSDNIYTSRKLLTEQIENLNVTELRKYTHTEQVAVTIDEVQINSFVTSGQSIYNIRQIDRELGNLILRKIYNQLDLTWGDYY